MEKRLLLFIIKCFPILLKLCADCLFGCLKRHDVGCCRYPRYGIQVKECAKGEGSDMCMSLTVYRIAYICINIYNNIHIMIVGLGSFWRG